MIEEGSYNAPTIHTRPLPRRKSDYKAESAREANITMSWVMTCVCLFSPPL